eukprot:NODE_2316_length_1233_cov_29.216216_g2111_i0.p1 GENE.NODE_2316_length_1233_cov_29.216216_g2111_i0~~NODE_2316_length_1233_cov_29.216216_g2111_i0.p1  ORF type:complete len:393 (-),score=79.24 NODE_2316_length_1233_cov_29.216216_g2111_i0:53-1183(-)
MKVGAGRKRRTGAIAVGAALLLFGILHLVRHSGPSLQAAVTVPMPPEAIAPRPLTDRERAQRCLNRWGADHRDYYSNPETCPETMPEDLHDRYTMGGKIRVVPMYKCQSGAKYAAKRLDYTVDLVEDLLRRARGRGWEKYGMTDEWLHTALDAYSLSGKDVVVMGSQTPWYESVVLSRDAKSSTTIDFQAIKSYHPNVTTLTLAEYDQAPRQFDVAISISSFEHDGLGRYGDPIRPESDIEAMKKMKCLVRPGGFMVLSLPIGLDTVVWNMHRVYGRVRLPEMLRHWKLLDVFGYGFGERYNGHDGGREAEYQPIFILENAEPTTGANDAVLEQYCERSKSERFVFPFGKHVDTDNICYNPDQAQCGPEQIKPRFW